MTNQRKVPAHPDGSLPRLAAGYVFAHVSVAYGLLPLYLDPDKKLYMSVVSSVLLLAQVVLAVNITFGLMLFGFASSRKWVRESLVVFPALVSAAYVTALSYPEWAALSRDAYPDWSFPHGWMYPVVNYGVCVLGLLSPGAVAYSRYFWVDATDEDTPVDDLFEGEDECPAPDPVPVPALPSASRRARADARRARRIRAATIPGHEITGREFRRLGEGACVYCGSAAGTTDHVRPLSRGGWHHRDNMEPACAACNVGKNSLLLVEWARERPDLVLHGCMMSSSVLAALACEMREVTRVAVRTPPATEIVADACTRAGRADLIPTSQLVEVSRPDVVMKLPIAGVPFPPIRSADTHPDVDAAVTKSWVAYGRSQSSAAPRGGTRPDLPALWRQWHRITVTHPLPTAAIARTALPKSFLDREGVPA